MLEVQLDRGLEKQGFVSRGDSSSTQEWGGFGEEKRGVLCGV